MPSLMAARWVGQNSGPNISHLWTKVHLIKFAYVGVSVVCNAIFWLMMYCCVLETSAIKSQSCVKSRWNVDILGERGHTNFWPNFTNLGHHQTCNKVWWRLAKQPRRLGGKKRRKTERMADGQHSWRAAIKIEQKIEKQAVTTTYM